MQQMIIKDSQWNLIADNAMPRLRLDKIQDPK
jgi:hypothetical protein